MTPIRAKKKPRADWPKLKAFALSLDLPHVEETTSWGEPVLKAHGKLWVWWSPHEEAPVFKVPFEEREILLEAAGDEFYITPHYKGHQLVLVRPDRLNLDWVRANLLRVWRAQAPKRVLKAYDDSQAARSEPPTDTTATAASRRRASPAKRKA